MEQAGHPRRIIHAVWIKIRPREAGRVPWLAGATSSGQLRDLPRKPTKVIG